MVLLCGGLVGPIFLAVYFALGSMARPYLNWMFWAGLLITAVDVLVALILANKGSGAKAPHGELTTPAHVAVPVMAPAPLSVSQRLQQLDMLHATGAITDDEYSAKRLDILDQI